jgi:hypothetical protein
MNNQYFFVFDVESIGLHGEGFAVGGGVFLNGNAITEFQFSCPRDQAKGRDKDRDWVDFNIPSIDITHETPAQVRHAFWEEWMTAKHKFPGIVMAGECFWPVEANFVSSCVSDDETRTWEGPYPFHEVSSFMLAGGMDPMGRYDRLPHELPCHTPLADARLSARLLMESFRNLNKT